MVEILTFVVTLNTIACVRFCFRCSAYTNEKRELFFLMYSRRSIDVTCTTPPCHVIEAE